MNIHQVVLDYSLIVLYSWLGLAVVFAASHIFWDYWHRKRTAVEKNMEG